MKLLPIFILALTTASCSASADRAASMSSDSSRCHESVGTVSISLQPGSITRGSSETIAVDWELDQNVSVPVMAHLTTGPAYSIEYVTELPHRGGTAAQYGIDIINPFGMLPAADYISVYVWLAVPTSCPAPTDATSGLPLN